MPKSKVRAKARKKAVQARTDRHVSKGGCPDSCCSTSSPSPVPDRPRR